MALGPIHTSAWEPQPPVKGHTEPEVQIAAGLPRVLPGHVACGSLGIQGGSPGGPSLRADLVGRQH